ncbi:hypothetical protein FSP39_016308 [Pinctada imbricata]|uniref:Uncharacterized protein n=1 Tax=Pinctada imbricata TaxID=66713 RepID=A0AA89C6P9_PINIB|nr:hypothetical protein FSP39_016308 [Pinctada imbricata]
MAYNCWNFMKERHYVTGSLTSQEKEFPLAYSITMHDSVFQFETLLRAIYRPQNYYCIQVDRKAPQLLLDGVKNIAKCFSNVFCDTHRIDVRPNSLSIAHAHLSCMRKLLIYPKWKYYMNLNEGDFPLKTNYEITEILKSLNGSNDVQGLPYRHINGKIYHPPHGLFGFTGSPRVLLNRQTAEFVGRNPQSNSILAWAIRTKQPYRNFFATINYNPRLSLPGTYHGPLDESVLKSYRHIVQYTVSKLPKSEQRKSCRGRLQGETCVFGVDDMPTLYKRKELLVHKVKWDYQGVVLACLEHEIQRRTRLQYLIPRKYDTRFYRNLTFIKYST